MEIIEKQIYINAFCVAELGNKQMRETAHVPMNTAEIEAKTIGTAFLKTVKPDNIEMLNESKRIFLTASLLDNK